MKGKGLLLGAMAAAGAMFVTGALGPLSAERSRARLGAPVTPGSVLIQSSSRGLDDRIAALNARVSANPGDPALHAQLGLAYLEQARSAAAPRYLTLAEQALERSLALDATDNVEAFIGMASLSNARHDFSASVTWARRAIEVNAYSSTGYGLLGDALFELGKVRAADRAYEDMVTRRPDVASYVRASYALQYQGRMRAALVAMERAVEAAGPTGETAAWVRHQLGDIYASLKDHKESERQNRIGMAIAPGYAPPMVGLAEAMIAQGRLRDAIPLVEGAIETLPSLEYLTVLGDLYRATGRDDDADEQYARVAAALARYREHGVLPDADFIVFYADHRLRPRAALREALAIYQIRPTGKTADALGWILHTVGRDRRAWRYARAAVNSGGADASMLFHAGVIADALGRDVASDRLIRRALGLDPSFSVVQAPVATEMLR